MNRPGLSWLIAISWAAGCAGDGTYPAPDLTEPLGPGQVRAGQIDDEASLTGGISADGQIGDVLLYNDRVRFVVQGNRDGDFYVAEGGGVIDADVIRPEDQPGRDLVDEWVGMYGLGRLVEPESVAVLDDGSLTGLAVVRVEGAEVPMGLITGSVGSDALVPELGLRLRVDYALAADSPLLRVTTTITAADGDVSALDPGDLLLGSLDAGGPWHPGSGLETPSGDLAWSGFIGDRNEAALAVFPDAGRSLEAGGASDILRALIEYTGGFGETLEIPDGESATYTRYYGAGPDLASLTDAWMDETGQESQLAEGQVTAPDGPVAGARVNVLADGSPWTLAITDDEGRFQALAPAGAEVSFLADGRGTGKHLDLPAGAAQWSPYAAEAARAAALDSLSGGAAPIPLAEGRGAGTEEDPLSLGAPATLTLTASDGLPFEARLYFTEEDPAADERLVRERPHGYAALAWARDGAVELPVEPGRYTLLAWRGAGAELFQQDVELVAGEALAVDVELPAAYALDGWLRADPHSHAGPSGDGEIPVEDRLITMAGVGVQVHFGTDHDHTVPYSDLLAPLGLDGVLASVIADELSPVLQGHVNVYPADRVASRPNGGAFQWWSEPFTDTEDLFSQVRIRNEDALLQLNHPLDSGVGAAAGWSPGRIDDPSRWSADFDAIEVLNSGDHEESLAFYADLFSRGVLSAPVGVSDSHGHLSGRPGLNLTFVQAGISDVAGDPEGAARATIDAIAQRRTVVSLGPFLSLSIPPGETITAPTELTADALSPSWIVVDRLHLMRDGEIVDTVEGASATFQLDADADAWFSVIAEGDAPMSPISGDFPWAFTSPILLNLDGGAWDPPLPPLEIAD